MCMNDEENVMWWEIEINEEVWKEIGESLWERLAGYAEADSGKPSGEKDERKGEGAEKKKGGEREQEEKEREKRRREKGRNLRQCRKPQTDERCIVSRQLRSSDSGKD